MMSGMEVAAIINNSNCALCTLGPPPDMILRLPPPPIPSFLQQGSEFFTDSETVIFRSHHNDSPCKHFCNWRSEGVQYIEIPQQGTVFDDTWLLVLISSCVGVICIGIILATLLLKCKFNATGKSGVISVPTATSGMQTKAGRLQNEAVLYPCTTETMQDSRVMWATLTPRGTTRHFLEEHTYETIGNGSSFYNNKRINETNSNGAYYNKRSFSTLPPEHTYVEPPVASPSQNRPKDDKAFDNTAFVDYEEPLSVKNEYYQLDDVLEPNDAELYPMQRGTLRPRVSSPTRIEHPNLPPLNLQPHKYGTRKNSGNQHSLDTLSRNGTPSNYVPTI